MNEPDKNQTFSQPIKKVGGHVSSAGGPLNAIKNTLSIGGNCMQFFAGSPRMWRRSLYDQETCQEFRQEVSSQNLNPVFIHALYLTNLASDKKELREKTKKALITDMKNSSRLASAGVIIHIGSHQGRGFDSVKELLVQEITEILEKTPKDSTLILENTAGQKGKIGKLEELGYLLQELSSQRVKICLDTAHAFEAGNAIHTHQGLDIFVKQIKKHLGLENVAVLHVNDSRTKFASGHDVHDNIGQGFIGKRAIKKLLNHPDLANLPIILEVPGFDGKGPDTKNIQIIKSLLEPSS